LGFYVDIATLNMFRFVPSETSANVVVLFCVGVVVVPFVFVPNETAAAVPACVTIRYTRAPTGGEAVAVIDTA
jgi:hypothetical protein